MSVVPPGLSTAGKSPSWSSRSCLDSSPAVVVPGERGGETRHGSAGYDTGGISDWREENKMDLASARLFV